LRLGALVGILAIRKLSIKIDTRQDSIETKLNLILAKIVGIEKQETTIMADLTALTAQVTASTTVEASAITLLQGLSAQIASLKNDPVALQALADQLQASQTALAAAIVANTPAT